MESDYVDYNICCLMPETSWLLFALMKADSAQLWQLYICTHIHCPSHAGCRAVTNIWFLFVCLLLGEQSVVLKRRSLLPRRAGDYLSSAVTLLSTPLSHGALLLKRHTEGFTCQFKMFLVDVLQWRAAEVTERTSAQVSDLNIFHKVENYFIFF